MNDWLTDWCSQCHGSTQSLTKQKNPRHEWKFSKKEKTVMNESSVFSLWRFRYALRENIYVGENVYRVCTGKLLFSPWVYLWHCWYMLRFFWRTHVCVCEGENLYRVHTEKPLNCHHAISSVFLYFWPVFGSGAGPLFIIIGCCFHTTTTVMKEWQVDSEQDKQSEWVCMCDSWGGGVLWQTTIKHCAPIVFLLHSACKICLQ